MPTRTVYRRALAKQLGPYHQGTATSGSSTSALEDTGFLIKTSSDTSDLYVDHFLYRPSAATADKSRYVDTYTPASGLLNVDLAWSVNPYVAGTGETYELHGVLSPDVEHELINESLNRIMCVVDATVTPVANQIRHSLAALTWMETPLWVYQVGWLNTGEDVDEVDPYENRVVRGWAEQVNGVVYLKHKGKTFASNQTIYAKCVRPAYTFCKANGGSFGDLTAGLTAETDEAVPPTNLVVAGALVEAWKRYGRVLDERGDQRILKDRAEAAAWFEQLFTEWYDEPDRTFRKLHHGGPMLSYGAVSGTPYIGA